MYGKDLFRMVYGVLKDQKLTEDLMQEVLLQIYHSLPQYRGQGLKTWMARIAINKAIDFKRKAYVRREFVSDQAIPMQMSQEVRPVEQEVLRKEQIHWVRKKIEELPAQYREIVFAYYMEGKSYQDIAAQTGLEYKSVESRLYRARKWIQKHWKEDVW